MRATLADRDKISSDDNVELLLGTFNDGRQAVVFGVNPLGVQMDGTLVENESGARRRLRRSATIAREAPDLSPDFVFQSKGRVTEYGYEVEVRDSVQEPQVSERRRADVGLQRRAHRAALGARGQLGAGAARERVVPRAVGHARGADRPASRARARRQPRADAADVGRARDAAPTTGDYDARAARSSAATCAGASRNNLTLNGTVNPDFSQIESDAGQFAFDPRQALFFPEKRPFFLDGIEQFATPNNLVYTRRIVQPVAAAKLTGKISGFSLGAAQRGGRHRRLDSTA